MENGKLAEVVISVAPAFRRTDSGKQAYAQKRSSRLKFKFIHGSILGHNNCYIILSNKT